MSAIPSAEREITADPVGQGGDLSEIHVELKEDQESTALEAAWTRLQEQSDHSFFQSWNWISCWREMLPDRLRPLVLEARLEGTIVGLGLLVEHRDRRRLVINSRAVHLHQTGLEAFDSLTIEHNGFLTNRHHTLPATAACLDFLAQGIRSGRWHEAVLPGVPADYETLAAGTGASALVWKREVSHTIALRRIREAGSDYMSTLSKKARQQIRRTLKCYEEIGPLSVTEAASPEEASRFLNAMISLHQAEWTARGQAGAFAQPHIVQFHRSLVERCFTAGDIQLARVSAGDRTLAYTYYFDYGGRIYCYQWGVDFQESAKINLGLMIEYLIIRHNLAKDAEVFDFLHGDTAHKRRLGTDQDERLWLVVQQDRLDFRAENALRRLKRRYLD